MLLISDAVQSARKSFTFSGANAPTLGVDNVAGEEVEAVVSVIIA
jgi:hypothetical protein